MRKFEEANQFYEKALKILIDSLGLDHIEVARTYKSQGYLFQAQGKFKAAKDTHILARELYHLYVGEENDKREKVEDQSFHYLCTKGYFTLDDEALELLESEPDNNETFIDGILQEEEGLNFDRMTDTPNERKITIKHYIQEFPNMGFVVGNLKLQRSIIRILEDLETYT